MAPPKAIPKQCLFCWKIYRDYQILESHTNLHTGENPYGCQECDASFPYFSNLGRHRNLVHLKIRYNCNLCSASYAGNQDLRSHMDRIHYGKKYICEGCRTQYSSHVTLKRHRDGGFCHGVKKVLYSIKMRKLEEKFNKVVKETKQKKESKDVKQVNRKLSKPREDLTGSGGRRKTTTRRSCNGRASNEEYKIMVSKKEDAKSSNHQRSKVPQEISVKAKEIEQESHKFLNVSLAQSSETFPVVSTMTMGLEIGTGSKNKMYKVPQLNSNSKKKRNEDYDLFFLHLNRYDPASI